MREVVKICIMHFIEPMKENIELGTNTLTLGNKHWNNLKPIYPKF
jgi:hypothetical protein